MDLWNNQDISGGKYGAAQCNDGSRFQIGHKADIYTGHTGSLHHNNIGNGANDGKIAGKGGDQC